MPELTRSLAWTLKAWCGLLLPVTPGPHEGKHRDQKWKLVRMEFKGFMNALIRLPCQIVRTGRRIIYRLLAWNPWAGSPNPPGRGDAPAAATLRQR